MKKYARTFAPVMLGCSLIAGAGWLNAQVADTIMVHVNHSFMISDKTLPPGDYTLRMSTDPAQQVMTIQNKSGENLAEFPVRQSIDNRTPKHTELVFRKYGNVEFLSKIYEGGSKNGVSVTEDSKEEKKLVSGGQHGEEHAEEQP